MRPQNATERKKAFTTFLLLFVVTTALLFIAVFFGMTLPGSLSKEYKTRLDDYEGKELSRTDFAQRAIQVSSLASKDMTDPSIARKMDNLLGDMSVMAEQDTTQRAFYTAVLQIGKKLKELKLSEATLGSKDDEMRKKDKRIEELTQDVAGWKDSYDRLKRESAN